MLALILTPAAFAQTDDLSDSAAGPIKLFERGQNAHARVIRKTTLLSIRGLAESGPERVRDFLMRAKIGTNFPDGVDLAFSLAQAETNKDERDQFNGERARPVFDRQSN